MLLLILVKIYHKYGFNCHSNTSHVTINHSKSWHMEEVADSNTSHVTINHTGIAIFQNGSKYSNTSHVTINHGEHTLGEPLETAFKYISCYY